MGQFNPGYQPPIADFSNSFSGGSEETPLGSGAPQGGGGSTSGFNGASLVQTNGNPQGGVYGQPGAFGNPVAPQTQNQSQFGNPGWKPSFSAPGSYNPSQYATDGTANELAQGLGGKVFRTTTPGPFGDFGQNLIDFGNGNQLNAGLLGERYAKYDAATANAMTDVEKNAGPVVTNPNAGAIFMNGKPMPGATPAPPIASSHNAAPVANPHNPLGGPGSEPLLAAPQQSTPQTGPQPGGQQNQLMMLLQLLGMGGQQQRPQNRQPYANSGYYPNLPRGGNQMSPLSQPQQPQNNGITQQQLLSLLLGF